jgi:hypothetical protein
MSRPLLAQGRRAMALFSRRLFGVQGTWIEQRPASEVDTEQPSTPA